MLSLCMETDSLGVGFVEATIGNLLKLWYIHVCWSCIFLRHCPDVRYEHIDENLWKSELAYDHGEDRQGNDIGEHLL